MTVLLRILRITFRDKRRVLAAYFCMAGATGTFLILPYLFGEAIDQIGDMLRDGTVSDRTILVTGVMILAVGAARGLLAYGQTYLGESLGQRTVYHLRNSFYDRVQNLSFGFHDRFHTGNLMSRAIMDVEAIRMFVNVGLVRLPYFIALFILVPVMLIRIDWRLGLVSVSFMPLVAILIGLVRLQLRRIWLEVQQKMADLSTVLQENLTGVRVVKAFASEEYEREKFNSRSMDVSLDLVKAAKLDAFNGSVIVAAYLGTIGLILWYGGGRVIDGLMTPGELAQFLFYMQILSVPVRHTGQVVGNIARAMSAGDRLFEVLDTRSPVQESTKAVAMPRARGKVSFEDVSFNYDGGRAVLKHVSFQAEPGQVVALLGVPGSGKSTIVHLIPRFYDVTGGRLSVDGTDVRDATLNSLRSNVGIVQQDVFLFTSSISENIAYGKTDASLDEIVKAARVAQLDDFIRTMEAGYDTVIGERGVTLSGGQRQRLSIARAALLDPPILILDDATSSVDAHTEQQIREAMESVIRGRTTFVIAHRLSTVHKADLILVMSEGEIAEQGTHQDLLAMGGLYREVYDLQLRPQEEVMLEFDVPATAHMESKS